MRVERWVWTMLGVLITVSPPCAANNVTLSRAAMFDAPKGQQEVAATEGAHAADALTCTYYGDFMVRETGTDGPGPGPAFLVPVVGGQRPSCVAASGEHGVMLKTAGFGLVGRKGAFLFFDIVGDVNGAEPFMLVHAPDGRVIYTDSHGMTDGPGVRGVSVSGDVLHMSYTRGFNAPCSVLTHADACWKTILKEGHFSRAVASQAAPVAACAAAYRASKTPADDPNIITYDVEMTLTAQGQATVVRRGALGCDAVP